MDTTYHSNIPIELKESALGGLAVVVPEKA